MEGTVHLIDRYRVAQKQTGVTSSFSAPNAHIHRAYLPSVQNYYAQQEQAGCPQTQLSWGVKTYMLCNHYVNNSFYTSIDKLAESKVLLTI